MEQTFEITPPEKQWINHMHHTQDGCSLPPKYLSCPKSKPFCFREQTLLYTSCDSHHHQPFWQTKHLISHNYTRQWNMTKVWIISPKQKPKKVQTTFLPGFLFAFWEDLGWMKWKESGPGFKHMVTWHHIRTPHSFNLQLASEYTLDGAQTMLVAPMIQH